MKTVQAVYHNLRSSVKTPMAIAIDGLMGSGKSTLAENLSKLDRSIQVVWMDHFWKPMGKRREFTPDKSADEEYDYKRLFKDLLIPYSQNKTACYQKYNWITDSFGSEKYQINPRLTLILDGVSSFHPDILSRFTFDWLIWIDCPFAVRIPRAIKRDDELTLKLGKNPVEINEYLENEWIPMEINYYNKFRPDKKANVILNGLNDYRLNESEYQNSKVHNKYLNG